MFKTSVVMPNELSFLFKTIILTCQIYCLYCFAGATFFSYLVEDKTPSGLSYVEFLVHIHRQIQAKMS